MFFTPQAEHAWLHQMIGTWEVEHHCQMDPNQPASVIATREVVRSLGGVWIVAEAEGKMPDGEPSFTLMTLGYDPEQSQFVGTFIGSMMACLWVYRGQRVAGTNRLVLDTEGPDFTPGKLAKYQDSYEMMGDDHRIMTSQILRENGEWFSFMKATYRRVK